MSKANNDAPVFKVNPCYNLIEKHLWESLRLRFQDEHYEKFYSLIREQKGNCCFRCVSKNSYDRYNCTYRNANIHLLTKHGLESFVRMGRLSDHYSFLPEFIKDEVSEILRNLISLGLIPRRLRRSLRLFRNTSRDTSTLGWGVFIHEQLANIFMDFAEKYAPENIGMSDEEMKRLIEELLM